MTDRPGGHEAAIAVAPDATAVAVSVRTFDDGVDHCHQVEVIVATPIAAHHLGEIAAVRTRATRIRIDDQEAMGGQDLLDRVEAEAVVAVRATVDVENDGILPSRIEVDRLQQPGFDREPVALDVEALPGRRRAGLEEPGVEVRRKLDLTRLAI